jgi:hypothetical protein
MSVFKRKPVSSFILSPGLPLVISLLFPLRLLGADQPAPQTDQPASQPASSVPQAEQPASQPAQTAPQTVQPAPQAGQPAPKAPQPGPPAPPPEQPDSFGSLDAPRAYVTEKIIGFASYMDRFFGGNRHYQESNQSVLRLDLTRTVGYGDNHKFDLSGKLSLRLPGTEGRLRLWLETDPEDEIHDDPTRDTHTLQNKPSATRSTGLAARYTTAEERAWHLSTDAGIKLPITHLDPFARFKADYSTPMGDWRMKMAESVYWFNTLGVGETTQLDLEKVLSSSRLFRSSTNATWLRDTQNLDLVQSFSIYHTVNDRSALIYQLSASWISNPSFQATDYISLVYYRYRMHHKWLFLELSPQMHFPRDKEYKPSPAFTMRLEALFDESK